MKPHRILIRRTRFTSELRLVHNQPVARQLLLHLHRVGQACFPVPWAGMPNVKPGVILFWVIAGQGRLLVDHTLEMRLKPDTSFYFCGSGQKRLFEPDPGQMIVSRSFMFGGPGLDAWLEYLDVKRRPLFQLRYPQRIYEAYDRMKQLAHRQQLNWELKIHFILNAVLAELLLSRQLLASGQRALPIQIERAINAIATNPARDWQAIELAQIAGMSDRAFRALFHAAMNEPPHTYIQRIRMELARNLLADGRLLIKEIAAKLHFSSEFYFSNFFHKHAGLSPTDFRRLLDKTK